jgi:hypothetical protein
MIGGLNVAAIAFALAVCALTIAVAELVGRALHWIEDRWNERTARLERDEMQQLLTLLCEHLHEQLQQDEPPPRAVINLTAGQSHEVSKPLTDDIDFIAGAGQ